jgi:AraC-like DNA-binding protein
MDLQKSLVLQLLAYAAQREVQPQQLCALAGLSLPALKSKAKLNMTPKQLNDLWMNASHLSKDPLFGLHLGESMQATALGMVGLIIQHSSTVGEALEQAGSLVHLITDLFGMQISTGKRSFSVQFIPYKDGQREHTVAFRQMMDLFMAYTLHELDGLVLEKIQPLRVKLPHEAAQLPEYQRVLRCEDIKQSAEYVIELDLSYRDMPILTANYELQSLLLQKAGAMDQQLNGIPHLRTRLSSYLLANAYLGIPSLEELAANFNTSARTLQRRLQEEGLSYQQLAESVRKSLALHYLAAGTYPVKEISYILGYNEMSAFTRAFKRWTGSSPANYQKN